MGKNRKSKRQLIRDEKRKKKRSRDVADHEDSGRDAKRQRVDATTTKDDDAADDDPVPLDQEGVDTGDGFPQQTGGGLPEKEYFGMLSDEEQESFRRADELLEQNDFATDGERAAFLGDVFERARGSELKLASSQSCSRLMERLILLSDTRQKKHLFTQFGGHFLSLVTHRFASHCCEKLFLESAPAVTEELGAALEEGDPADGEKPQRPPYMEDLFLYTLDELEEHLSFLLSDRYASHTLRILLLVLSGRPLDQASTKSLVRGAGKENVTVAGGRAAGAAHELTSRNRAVPPSFTMAARKIIADATSKMDGTALRVLAKHPTGNPVLQLCLELDIALNTKSGGKKTSDGDGDGDDDDDDDDDDGTAEPTMPLVDRLVPGAPASLLEEGSSASEFVTSMLYDPIGSRLLETLITNCPGRIFKGLQAGIFGPRIHNLVRNDIASYPAMRVLGRLSREGLVDAVNKTLPQVPLLVEKGRFNVLRTLLERCEARRAASELDGLVAAIVAAYGGEENLVPGLCFLGDEVAEEEKKKKKEFQQDTKSRTVLASHGSQLATTMLGIAGSPRAAVQASLAVLPPELLLRLATSSPQAAGLLVTSLATPQQQQKQPSGGFHKALVAGLAPYAVDLALSQYGQRVLAAVIGAPSRGEGITVPFFLKETIASRLAAREKEIRETEPGTRAWRAWRGDLWTRRRAEWVRWAKAADPEDARQAGAPHPKPRPTPGGSFAGKERKRKGAAIAV